jgi:serine/threonine protein kinase
MTESFSRPLFTKIAEAIRHYQIRGIVHRDLKLENILVQVDPTTQEWMPKIIDFGLAEVLL